MKKLLVVLGIVLFCFVAFAQETLPVEMLQISSNSISIEVGEEEQLYITLLLPSDATDPCLKWQSDDPEIATVSVGGIVKGVSKGMTTVYLSANDGSGIRAVCEVEVKQSARELAMEKSRITVERGKTKQIDIKVIPENADNAEILWKSSKPYTAYVDKNGIVTGRERGEATITATLRSDSSVTAECAVTVTWATLEEIVPEKTEISMGIGESMTLGYTLVPEAAENTVRYKSSDENIATVDEKGTICAVGEGECVITLSAAGKTAECAVHVGKAPEYVKFAAKTMSIGLGETVTLQPEYSEGSCTTPVWSLGNKKILALEENGTVTGLATGYTNVKVTTHNKKSASIRVNVLAAPTEILSDKEEYSLPEGTETECDIRVGKKQAGRITCAMEDPAIAEWTEAGSIKGLKPGKTVLIAETYNGIAKRIPVTVTPEITQIVGEDLILRVGQAEYPAYTLLPEGAAGKITAEFAEGDNCVSFKKDGTIKGKKAGECTVTLKSDTGVTAVIHVTVQ